MGENQKDKGKGKEKKTNDDTNDGDQGKRKFKRGDLVEYKDEHLYYQPRGTSCSLFERLEDVGIYRKAKYHPSPASVRLVETREAPEGNRLNELEDDLDDAYRRIEDLENTIQGLCSLFQTMSIDFLKDAGEKNSDTKKKSDK